MKKKIVQYKRGESQQKCIHKKLLEVIESRQDLSGEERRLIVEIFSELPAEALIRFLRQLNVVKP